MLESKEVRLSEVIAPAFFQVHDDICGKKHTHYWLKGGRGSTKSSFVSLEIILGMMADPLANGVAIRKVGVNLKDSVFEQLRWAIRMLGIEEYWEVRVSPLELTYKKTGQKIIFRGADNPRKIKSSKFINGYAKFIWYEEVDEFPGVEEIRTINQSLMRGGEGFCVFYSYNPPKSQRNWVNLEVLEERPDKYVHHSTYLEVPKKWLGEQFFIEAEHIKKTKPQSYAHEYLGEVTGTGGEVFRNITIRQISEEEVEGFDHIARGLDWGYAIDPFHYTVNHFDRRHRRLYIFFEIQKVGLRNRDAAEMILQENCSLGEVVADSAEPKSIAELREYGVPIVAARKGPDSVSYGIKWLQDLEEIIIDPKRCPQTAREFQKYELDRDGNGGFRCGFPDRDNHGLDAIRYSRERDMQVVRVR